MLTDWEYDEWCQLEAEQAWIEEYDERQAKRRADAEAFIIGTAVAIGDAMADRIIEVEAEAIIEDDGCYN